MRFPSHEKRRHQTAQRLCEQIDQNRNDFRNVDGNFPRRRYLSVSWAITLLKSADYAQNFFSGYSFVWALAGRLD